MKTVIYTCDICGNVIEKGRGEDFYNLSLVQDSARFNPALRDTHLEICDACNSYIDAVLESMKAHKELIHD